VFKETGLAVETSKNMDMREVLEKVKWLGGAAVAFCVIAAMVMGCSGSGDRAVEAPPAGEPDITGIISAVTKVEGDPDLLGSILVDAMDSAESRYDMAAVTVTTETGMYDAAELTAPPVRVGFDALAEGQSVAVYFTGPVAESYPAQAKAAYIYLVAPEAGGGDSGNGRYGEILEVKNRHEDELMAINGVVGVGIGEGNGSPCIVVYLENDSKELESRVPEWVEGFPVITEVTGPIEAR